MIQVFNQDVDKLIRQIIDLISGKPKHEHNIETFEKYEFLFEFEKGEIFNHRNT